MSKMFTDPVAQVIIRDIESGEEWAWGSPQFPFLTSLSFAWTMKAINAFSVGVDIPYDMAMKYMDINSTPFKKNNVVRARIGYATGGWTEWEEGFLADGGKGLRVTPDGVSGPITATWVSPKVAGYTLDKAKLKEAGTDAKKLLNIIGKIMEIDVFISDGAERNLNAWRQRSSVAELHPGMKKRLSFFNGIADKPTLTVVRTLCERNNLEFWMGRKGARKTLFIAKPEEQLNGSMGSDSSVIRKYVIRGVLDESKNQYPVYDMSPADDSLTWLDRSPSGSASGVTAWNVDTEQGEILDFELDPSQQEVPIEGKVENTKPTDIAFSPDNTNELIADRVKADGEMGTFMSSPIHPGGSQTFEEQVKQFGLQGDPALRISIQTIGIPEEATGNTCELWGGGALNNGRYFIEGITHSWTPGNWDMEITGLRRGVKATTGDKQETLGGQMTK